MTVHVPSHTVLRGVTHFVHASSILYTYSEETPLSFTPSSLSLVSVAGGLVFFFC